MKHFFSFIFFKNMQEAKGLYMNLISPWMHDNWSIFFNSALKPNNYWNTRETVIALICYLMSHKELQYMFSVPECPDNECRAWSFLALFLCHRATAVLSRAIPPVCGIKMPDLNWHIERKENRLLTQKNIWESKSDDFRVGGKSAELFPEVGYLSLLKRCSSAPVTQILGKIQRMSMLMPQKTTAQCII